VKHGTSLLGIAALTLAACSCLGADGTLIHYTFDEGSGTVAGDSSGNGYNATLINSPTWTSGFVNGALHFDGASTYGVLANSPDLSAGSFTVTAWIYREGGVERKFVSKWDDNTANYQFDCQVYSDSKPWFQVQQSNNRGIIAQGTTVIQTGRWYHYAGVADTAAQQLRIYINGTLETLQSTPVWDGTIHPQSMPLNIGRKVSTNDYWQGKIDDVRIYQHALTQSEVQALIPPDVPQAQPDTYRASNVAATTFFAPGVLANDADLLGYNLTAVLDTQPANGALTFNADGSFTYKGNAGFTGNDTFTYHADNGHGGVSPPQIVTMQIPVVPISISSISPSSGVNQQLTGVRITGSNFYQIGYIPPGSTAFGGHYYLMPAQSLAWADARDYCQSIGGHLVTIGSDAENTFVDNTFVQFVIWIGFTDQVQEGSFKWVTGEPITYTNWFPGEPNNSGGNENFADMYNAANSGHWNDENGTALRPFVCEFDHGQLPTIVLKKSGQPDLAVTNVSMPDSSTLTFDLNLIGVASGNWDVVVTNPDGQSAILPGGFVIGHTPPVAQNDNYTGSANAPLIQAAPGVLINDSQVNNLSLTALLVTQATHGTVTLNNNGSFTYSPNAGFAGVDSFQYLANDGVASSAPASATIIVQGLVGWWKLDDGSGGVAVDSANGHTASLVGSPTWVSGVTGSALSFNGTTDYASIPDAPELRLPNDLTVAFWMRKQGTATDWARLVGKGNDPNRNFGIWDQGSHGTRILFQQYGPGPVNILELTSASSVPQNKWTHVAVTIQGNTARIYLNGVLDITGTRAETALTSFDPLTFAYAGYGVPFPGSLDDIRVYNRALSTSEVLGLIPQAPPNVTNDSYTIGSAQPLTIAAPGVLANDTDINSDALTAIKVTDPVNGTVVLNSNGSFTYTPNAGFDGTDSFTYKANDGFADSSPATVTIDVGGTPLPAGNVKRMLHLGASEHDLITGFPTSGQSILWDFMRFAGVGPEYIQQPSPGQTVDFHLGTSNGTTLTWTDLTTADASGLWGRNSGSSYVMYYALYVRVPSTRQAVLAYSIDDYLKVWMDSQPTPIPTTVAAGSGISPAFTLSAGWHAFIFKTMQNTGPDYFGIRFANPDGTDMTDLRYSTYDTVAPNVTQIVPNNGATAVPNWNDVFISFSEAMDTTVAANTVATLSGGTATGNWAWTDSHTLVFTPSVLLDSGATYTVTLNSTLLKDVAGNALTGSTQSTFSVNNTGIAPQLTSLSANTGTPGQFISNISATGSGYSLGAIPHPPGATPFQGHYYQFADGTQTTSWHNAITVCAAKSGHLATPSTASEDAFTWSFGGFMNCWIGFSDEGGGPWRWIDGQPVTYTNWSPGMPDDWGGEYYGIYWWSFGWNDVGDDPSAKRPYVCEFDQQSGPAVSLVRTGFTTLPAQNVKFVNSGSLSFDLNLTGAVEGAYDVVITNSNGTQAVLPGGFTVDGTPPHITAMAPTPGQTLSAAPTVITLDMDKALDPATVNASTVRIARAGPDGVLGTADDIAVPAKSIALVGNQIQLDLTDQFPPNDKYRVTAGKEDIAGQTLRYTFSEGSGTTTADISGNGHTGSLSGPAWTGGVRGSGLDFNTDTAAVNIGLPDLPPPWTATLWVNRHDSPQVSSDMLWSNNVVFKLEQYYKLKKVGITIVGSTNYAFNYTAPVGQWVQLTFVGTERTTALYVNGALQDTMNVAFNLPRTCIGSPGGNSVRAILDDVRYFNRSLAPNEIAALYSNQVADLAGNALDGAFDGTHFPTGNGGSADFSADFTITAPTPQLTAIAPASGDQDTTVALTLSGSNLPVYSGPTGGAKAVSFDGVNDSFHVPSSNFLNSSNFTIEVWMKEGFYVLKRNDWPGIWEQFIVSAGAGSGVTFWVANNFQRFPLTSSSPISHEWTHIACTYDGSVQRIYVNGVLDNQNTVNIPVSPYNEFMSFYNDPWWSGGFSNGSMSEFRFWNVTRTQAQIQSTMNSQLTAGAPNLVCRYDFANGGPNLLDTTGNGHNAAPIDHPSFTAFRPTAPVLVRLQNVSASVYASGTLTSTDSQLNCSIDLTGVPAGVYDVQLLENGQAAATLPQSFTVTLPPRLTVTTTESLPLTYSTYTNGPAPGDKLLQLANAGARSFDWSVSSDAAWLTVTPSSGTALTSAAGSTPLTVHVDASALLNANSPFNATLTFTASGALNSPKTIPVTLIISPADQLLAYYPFDESGAIAHDVSGGGHDGSVINTTLSGNTGIFTAPLTLDGATQFVDVSNTSGLDFHQSDFTVAAWVYPLNLANEQMIVSRERDNDPSYQFRLSLQPGGQPQFQISNSTCTDYTYPMICPFSLRQSQWAHVAITRVGQTFTLYVNGYAVITKTTATVIDFQSLYNLRIGARYAISGTGAERWFKGSIDEVRIYGRALDALEVARLGGGLITDTDGTVLDGENNGPGNLSGDGAPGGNYVQTFTISTPKLQILQVTPAPNATLAAAPAYVSVSFSKDIDPSTLTSASFRLVRPGPDGIFGTADDLVIIPATISMLDSVTAKLDLTGARLPNGQYQVRLLGSGAAPLSDLNGNILDGDADGNAGGDFISTFTVAATALQVTQLSFTPGSTLAQKPQSITATFNHAIDPASLTSQSMRLLNAGPDGQFGTSDDVVVTPTSISLVAPNQARLNLASTPIADGNYQLQLLSGLSVTSTAAAWWKFDETSGLNFSDASGHGNSGTLTASNSCIFSSGVNGNALNVTSYSGFAAVSNGALGSFGTSDFSVAFWVKTTGANCHLIGNRYSTNHANFWTVKLSNTGTVNLEVDQDTVGTNYWNTGGATHSVNDNTWHHIAVTRVGPTLTVYVDGALDISTTAPATTNLTNSGQPIVLANTPYIGLHGSEFMTGLFDDVFIFNRAVSANEIQALHSFNPAGIADLNGNALDGDGDNIAGGNYSANFTLATPPLQVTQLNITPGSTLTQKPQNITVTFNKDVDPVSVNPQSLRLIAAGPDGQFGTSDDVGITPASITLPTTNQALLDLSGIFLNDGKYKVVVSGTGPIASAVADLNGNVLDGDKDGTPGGDYTATFTLERPKLKVTQASPAPGSVLAASPQSIVVNLSKDLNISTVNASTVTLTGSGPDHLFGTADDQLVSNLTITASGPRQIVLNLNGITLPDDSYQLRLSGVGISDTDGLALDGEFDGTHFPSGDGTAGGDFAASFRVQSAPIASSGTISTAENTIVFGTLTAVSASNAPLTYTIVGNGAKGTAQIVTGGQFSYTPNFGAFGIDTFTFKANDGLSDSNIATFAIAINQTLALPVLTSPAAATPNPALVGQDIGFSVGAQSSTGEALVYVWDFSDGSQSLGQNISHAYAAAGTYSAVVTVFSAAGSISSTVSVVVTVPEIPPDGGPAAPTVSFSITKMNGAVKFAKAGHDTVKFAGVIPKVAPAFSPLGTSVSINVSGAVVVFTLDKNGHARNSNGELVIRPAHPARASKSKLRTFGGDLKFTAVLAGAFAKTWNMDSNTSVKAKPMTMSVTIILNGVTYVTLVPVTYTATAKVGGKFSN
jgi:hypothetical protein